mmetsp:Transcript_17258/g.19237  ORF Transcript_17258/g.19237 Transcript_17258/m.19237 type:complete len:246 (-) Transcript_17258:359-1096(-)
MMAKLSDKANQMPVKRTRKSDDRYSVSAKQILDLPLELQYMITTMDKDVFILWPLLCAGAALTSRFSADFKKSNTWKCWNNNTLVKQTHWDKGLQNGISKAWYVSNKVPRSICWYKDGKYHGEYKAWFSDGKLRTLINFKHGKKDGLYKFFLPNGKIHVEANYKQDKLHGEYKSWHSEGTPHIQCFCKDGELDGEYKSWYKNKKLESHYFMKEGKKHGVYKKWTDDGSIKEHCKYTNDALQHITI